MRWDQRSFALVARHVPSKDKALDIPAASRDGESSFHVGNPGDGFDRQGVPFPRDPQASGCTRNTPFWLPYGLGTLWVAWASSLHLPSMISRY
jgi:hypothetical protein